MGADIKLRRLLAAGAATAINLMVRGQYDVLEAMTRGRHLSAGQLRAAVEERDIQLALLPDDEWDLMEVRELPDAERPTYEVSVPLWSSNGPAPLALDLRFIDLYGQAFETEVLGFHEAVGIRSVSSGRGVGGPAVSRQTPVSQARPEADPIPKRWRLIFASIVHRLVVGDYEGLARDGYLAFTDDPADRSIGTWIEGHTRKLVDLPDEAWAASDHHAIEGEPNAWAVHLDLWDEAGPSGLTLMAEVRDDGSSVEVRVEDVHPL
jgi:hypothetical protein